MDIIEKLSRLKIETGSLACLGCEDEDACSVHGCAILREAQEEIFLLRQSLTLYARCLDDQEKWRRKDENNENAANR